MKKVLMAAIAAISLVGAVSAHAENVNALVYEAQDLRVTITPEACTSPKVLAMIEDEFKANFRAGNVVWHGQRLKMCWTVLPNGFVLIADETGDSGTIPLSEFKPNYGV